VQQRHDASARLDDVGGDHRIANGQLQRVLRLAAGRAGRIGVHPVNGDGVEHEALACAHPHHRLSVFVHPRIDDGAVIALGIEVAFKDVAGFARPRPGAPRRIGFTGWPRVCLAHRP